MLPIGAGELADMAETAAALMASSAAAIGQAAIQARTRTPDGRGGGEETWSTIATVDAVLSAGSRLPRFQRVAEQEDVQRLWTLSVPAGTDVPLKGRVLIAGRTLEVVAVAGPESFETMLTVLTRTLE